MNSVGRQSSFEWREISRNWVLVPSRPVAILHFLGGAFVAAAPHVTYCRLLEALARQGYVVVATPFLNTFDHRAITEEVLYSFERVMSYLHDTVLRNRYLPIYGIGHSMGSKLHLLVGSLFPVERAGNILISFNNFPVRRSIPFSDPLVTSLAVEFTPSPAETIDLISQQYRVRRNLLVKFTNDDLDQTQVLKTVLLSQFPDMVVEQTLAGTHLTPMGPDFKWQVSSEFSPFDAIAQWLRQSIYQELHQLEKAMLLWLDPCSISNR